MASTDWPSGESARGAPLPSLTAVEASVFRRYTPPFEPSARPASPNRTNRPSSDMSRTREKSNHDKSRSASSPTDRHIMFVGQLSCLSSTLPSRQTCWMIGRPGMRATSRCRPDIVTACRMSPPEGTSRSRAENQISSPAGAHASPKMSAQRSLRILICPC